MSQTLTTRVHELGLRLVKENPDWRTGQAYFNALVIEEPEIADFVRGQLIDPYYQDDRLPVFWQYVGSWDW